MADDVKLRPVDKIVGGVATLGVLGGAGTLLWYTLPVLLPLMGMTIALCVGGGILFAGAFVATDTGTKSLVGRAYRLGIQGLGLALIRYDPIGALRDHIGQLRKRAEEFLQHRTTLKGIVRNLTETLASIRKERETLLAQASTAGEMGEQREMSKMAAKAERRRETFEYLDGQRVQLEKVEIVIGKLAQEATDVIEDCEDELSQLTLRDKASAAASGALNAAMDILGDTDLLSQHKEAVAVIEERVGRRLAEIDMAMDKTTGLISGIDVKNATVDKAAIAAVLEYEKSKPARTDGHKKAAMSASTQQKKTL
jgi:hypothetical protein